MGRPRTRIEPIIGWLEKHQCLYGSKDRSKKKKSKVHHRSLNLFVCVILVSKLANRLFRSSNLFGWVISIPKIRNYTFRSSNLFSCVISVSKLDFEFHLGQNRTI